MTFYTTSSNHYCHWNNISRCYKWNVGWPNAIIEM